MRKIIGFISLLTCLLLPINIHAESGNDLLGHCNDYSTAKGTFGQGVCAGFVMGVAEVSNKICRPKDVTNKQLVLVVEKYLKDNPQELHYSATSLAEYALSKVWPCQK